MRLMISLLIMALILVACGEDATPEPTQGVSSDATHTPEPEGFQPEGEPTTIDDDNSFVLVSPQAPISDDVVPLPGTLAYDGGFVDEEMDAVFDRVVFTRSGGGEDSPVYLLKIKQDGTYELNFDTLGQVDASVVTDLDDLLDKINFFGISSPMVSTVPNPDKYRYAVTVERGTTSMTLHAEDGFIPQPVKPLFGSLMAVIVDSNNTAFATATPLP
jgi:hypothetical protein